MFNGIWLDLARAGRSLATARAFTFVCVVSLGIAMALVIAIPYWAPILRMPPVGVNTDGLVGVASMPRAPREAGATWYYPDLQTLRESDAGLAMSGWKSGTSKIAFATREGVRTEPVASMFVSANYFRT